MLSNLPRFNAARRFGPVLAGAGALLAVLGFVLLGDSRGPAPLLWFWGGAPSRALGFLGGALWLASAGFLSAALMSFARRRLLAAEASRREPPKLERVPAASNARGQRWFGAVADLVGRIRQRMPDARVLAGWPQALLPALFSAYAAVRVAMLWRLRPEAAIDPSLLKIVGGSLLVAAFPLLLLERVYANTPPELLPEAPQLERLSRVPLFACVGLALAMIVRSAGFYWAAWAEQAVAILIFVVALEMLLRSAVTLFVPLASFDERRSVADSAVAGAVLRLALPNVQAINITVRRQLGIDLSRSWALAFVQRAALPVIAGIGVFAWLITGVTALGISQRGVYERLGVPVAVFQPGLHIHLPWPLGIVRPVEVGVIHQLPIEFLLPGGGGQIQEEPKEARVSAEAAPPPSADRLWDDAHPFEGSYLIASEENGRQSFQLVDVDMAVIYQIGLSDDAARASAYRIADPNEFIQALSGRLLVRYLASNTLLNVLGENRQAFSGDFQKALQRQLDQFSSGIEILSISVEAIHPPPAAASAYHDVQAAEIRAQTKVALSRGDATRSEKMAERDATDDTDAATAAAAELVNGAEAASVLFGGDRQAYARNSNAFLLERWFGNLTQALPKSEYIIIDHRLSGPDVPTLDLRNFSAPAAQTAPLATQTAPAKANPAPAQPAGDEDDAD